MAGRHIIPTLGRLKLKNLTPAHVRGLYRERLDSRFSPRTVRYAHTTLNKALKQAVADELRTPQRGRVGEGSEATSYRD